MFDPFRFITVRPPPELNASRPISGETNSEIQARLRASDCLTRKAIANKHIHSQRFVKGWSNLGYARAFCESWKKLTAAADPSMAVGTTILTDGRPSYLAKPAAGSRVLAVPPRLDSLRTTTPQCQNLRTVSKVRRGAGQ
jgi:hypothetical protein